MPAIRSCSICSATIGRFAKQRGIFLNLPTACSRRSARSSPMRCTSDRLHARQNRRACIAIACRAANSPASPCCRRACRQRFELGRRGERDRCADRAAARPRARVVDSRPPGQPDRAAYPRARRHRRHAIQRAAPAHPRSKLRDDGPPASRSERSTSSRAKKPPSSSTRWRRRAARTCRATSNFSSNRNRFNVAISRARAASVLVCSPRLLDIACRTPEQMALANLLCAFAERARSDLERSGVPA